MTGEILESTREILGSIETHRLISSVFTSGQSSGNRNLSPIYVGHEPGIWYVLLGRKTASASIADFMFYTYEQERSASERSAVLSLVDRLNRELDSSVRPLKLISVEDSGKSSDMGFPSLMVEPGSGEVMKGTGYNLGDALDPLFNASTILSSNFPYPYHPDLDMFIKSLFLTRGLRLKPPLSRKFILENLVEDAYEHSIGVKKESIRREFQEIMREMVGSKVFRIKGAYVTYLSDLTEYRRRYQREYISYLDRISRKTIFDYDNRLY